MRYETIHNLKIPKIGFGTWSIGGHTLAEPSMDKSSLAALRSAISLGYTHFDTADMYSAGHCEEVLGRAIHESGAAREGLFITSKVSPHHLSYKGVLRSNENSLRRLGMDYLDLYLIHWPAAQLGKYVDSFGGLIQTRAHGLVRSIGVCNFTEEHLTTVIDLTFVTPAVNQIELHPLLNQAELRAANAAHDVVTEAYSPLAVGRLLDNPAVTSIAGEYGRTPAQVLIRWSLQLGNVVIPRSANPERIASNFDVLDFELADEHMEALNGLNDGTRVREDPLTYTGI
jgi:2,5-diketo-D-gluconate reductase A